MKQVMLEQSLLINHIGILLNNTKLNPLVYSRLFRALFDAKAFITEKKKIVVILFNP